jgi:hypothetical protein
LIEIGGVELLTFNIPQGNNLSKKIKKTFAYFFVHLPLLYYILAFQKISSLKTIFNPLLVFPWWKRTSIELLLFFPQ